MPRVIVPVLADSETPGLKLRTGETDDPAPLNRKEIESKTTAARMEKTKLPTLAPSADVRTVRPLPLLERRDRWSTRRLQK